MQHTSLSQGNPVTHKMKINLNVLGALMLNRVRCKIGGVDVITIDNGGTVRWTLEFMEELA